MVCMYQPASTQPPLSTSITRVTHALLTARLILTLRKSAQHNDGLTTDVMLDSIGFETNVQQCTDLTDSTDPGTLTSGTFTLPSEV